MLGEMPHIRLNMIVRNETHVITRCLESVKPFIDSWVIVDTGSVDDTMDKVTAALDQIPGELHQREWRDFGHNRTEALELARQGADFILMIDAEDVFETDDGFELGALREDAYYVPMVYRDRSWKLLMLVSAKKPWYWATKRHAAIMCREGFSSAVLKGARILVNSDGARRSAMSAQEKYGADAESFEHELEGDPKNTRAMFYCAQSHRDAGNHGKAIYWYEKRVEAGGWWEEVYESHVQLGHMYQAIGAPWSVAFDHYMAAYVMAPHRAEPLIAVARHHRSRKEYAMAHLFACAAKELPLPEHDLLWVDEGAYKWKALDEYALSAHRIGKLEEARVANERLLTLVPEREVTRIQNNLKWCQVGQSRSRVSVKNAG